MFFHNLSQATEGCLRTLLRTRAWTVTGRRPVVSLCTCGTGRATDPPRGPRTGGGVGLAAACMMRVHLRVGLDHTYRMMMGPPSSEVEFCSSFPPFCAPMMNYKYIHMCFGITELHEDETHELRGIMYSTWGCITILYMEFTCSVGSHE